MLLPKEICASDTEIIENKLKSMWRQLLFSHALLQKYPKEKKNTKHKQNSG